MGQVQQEVQLRCQGELVGADQGVSTGENLSSRHHEMITIVTRADSNLQQSAQLLLYKSAGGEYIIYLCEEVRVRNCTACKCTFKNATEIASFSHTG